MGGGVEVGFEQVLVTYVNKAMSVDSDTRNILLGSRGVGASSSNPCESGFQELSLSFLRSGSSMGGEFSFSMSEKFFNTIKETT